MSGTYSFTPTEADIHAVYRLHFSNALRNAVLIWLGVITLVLVTVYHSLGRDGRTPDIKTLYVPLLIAFAVAVGYRVFVHVFWLPRFAKRIFRQQADLRQATEMHWDSAALKASSPVSQSKMAWSEFIRWRRNGTMLLMYRSDVMMIFLPIPDALAKACADDIVVQLQAAGVPEKGRRA